MAEFEIKEGIFTDLTSDQYHGIRGVYSSSQLKHAYEDIEYFHKKYILREAAEDEEIPAFSVGTYFHTAVLEPEKMEAECVVYKGVRRGKDWDAFKEVHKGKAIITETEYRVAIGLVDAVKNSTIATSRIKRGRPEVSAFLKLTVVGSQIFCPSRGLLLSKHGWTNVSKVPKGIDIWTKVRADLKADTFILDLKSTTGNVKNNWEMRKKVSDYNYDLSAALYLDIFSAVENRTITEFVWTFASKEKLNCKNYIASADNIRVGRAKYSKAILNIAEGIQNDWKFMDYIEILEPNLYEYELIKEKAEDIL
ncbi:hypothetical protein EKK58_08380 [Candidatus Dependentiae bacterium]|nr:MAG: hypothetical protein EKK58_08380 [Candidatus Dependentiae bacterium]